MKSAIISSRASSELQYAVIRVLYSLRVVASPLCARLLPWRQRPPALPSFLSTSHPGKTDDRKIEACVRVMSKLLHSHGGGNRCKIKVLDPLSFPWGQNRLRVGKAFLNYRADYRKTLSNYKVVHTFFHNIHVSFTLSRIRDLIPRLMSYETEVNYALFCGYSFMSDNLYKSLCCQHTAIPCSFIRSIPISCIITIASSIRLPRSVKPYSTLSG